MKNIILFLLVGWFPAKGQEYDEGCEIYTDSMIYSHNSLNQPKSIDFKLKKRNLKKKQVLAVINSDTEECCKSFSIINLTEGEIFFSSQDGQIQAIREAKNRFGIWKPIEYWIDSWCGNSYSTETLNSNEYIKIETIKYQGFFKTKIRFKIKMQHKTIYSNSYIGFINKKQFKKPKAVSKSSFFQKSQKNKNRKKWRF